MTYFDRPLRERSLKALSAALANGETTSLALCKEALERAHSGLGRVTDVFIALNSDVILAQAKAMDQLRAANAAPSPFAGLPISIKDLADVAGEITAAGSKIHAGEPPATQDAPVISRLRQAGFVLFGRTNMSEYAFSGLGLNPHYGTPGNSLDPARAPGGSSSGAAVSVGLGMAAAALGSDTGGSVRAPSAVNGLAGFKPTSTSVPKDGIFPLSPTLDSIGPLAPTIDCCQVLHGVFSRSENKAALRPLKALRLAVVPTRVQEELAPEVTEAFEQSLTALAAAGASLERVEAPHLTEIAEMTPLINFPASEAYAIHRDNLAKRPGDFDARVRERIKLGAAMTAADYVDLIAARARLGAVHARLFSSFDAVLAPTCPILAPKLSEIENDTDAFVRQNLLMLRNTSLFNWLDVPAASIPIQAPGDQGVGLMVCGLPGDDWRTLNVAAVIEDVVRRDGR